MGAVAEMVAGPAVSANEFDAWAADLWGRLQHLVATLGSYADRASLELRYDSPSAGELHLYVVCRVLATDVELAAQDAEELYASVADALPDGYTLERRQSLPEPATGAIHEIRRTEEVLEAAPWSEATFYYAFRPRRTSLHTARAVVDALLQAPEPVTVSTVLQPTHLSGHEREALSVVHTGIAHDAAAHQEIDVRGEMVPVPGWEPAAAAERMWREFADRLGHGLLHRVTVAGSARSTQRIASVLAAPESAGPGDGRLPASHSIVSADDEHSARLARTALAFGAVLPWGGHRIWSHHTAPISLARLPYIVSEPDAASLLVLPLPRPTGCPGLPSAPARPSVTLPSGSDQGLRLGRIRSTGGGGGATATVGLEPTQLARHALVAGLVGSGKTSTVQSLLSQLWREHGIPWLVIEPKARPEYRNLLRAPGMEQLRIMPLGHPEVAATRLNPLEVPAGASLDSHVSALMSSFALATDLFDPLPELLEETLYHVYDAAGVDEAETADGWPSLSDVVAAVPGVFARKGYRGEAENLKSALLVRLQALTRGAKGLLLDTVESDDWQAVLDAPAVVELRGVDNVRDQALLVAFVMQRVRAAAMRRDGDAALRHLVVLEEAHRLLPDVGEQQHLRHAAVEQFTHDIAEMRSLGQGFVLCEQTPSRLHPAAVANTGTRVIHRLGSAQERGNLLADVGATDEQADAVGHLAPGEALVQTPDIPGCVFVDVTAPDVDTATGVTDAEVTTAMRPHSLRAQALLPMAACTRQVCVEGCDPERRKHGAKLARTGRRAAERQDDDGLLDAFRRFLHTAEVDGPTRYCALVHLDREVGALLPEDAPHADRIAVARRLIDG